MPTSISANTLFHFTKNADNLLSILRNDFYPQLCLEDNLGTIAGGDTNMEVTIPMVCFSDIPLSQVQEHTTRYGEYAIGLSKEWGMKNGINPVLYAHPDAKFYKDINSALNALSAVNKNMPVSKEVWINLFSALEYIKPYQGRLWRNGEWSRNTYLFYDEREWRYVPKGFEGEGYFRMAYEDYVRKEKEIFLEKFKERNEKLATISKIRLSFQSKDIKFIIVKKEEDILNVANRIEDIKKPKFEKDLVRVLLTGIISMETIRETF